MPGNGQGDQVLVNEVIVAEVGKLIGAPVRERALVTVPPVVTTWSDFPAAVSTVPLLAHGSLHVPHAVDDDDLTYTRRDDNARRQAAMLGLWDLCVGEDPQWLYETTAAYSVWSYDHGLWFSTGEGDWNAMVLNRLLDTNASFPNPPTEISVRALRETAARISSLASGELLTAVSAVPVEWGTGDEDLEAMAWFLFSRRGPVAHRLNDLAAAVSGRQTTGSSK
ncbi:hypothetical protein [Microbacterium elymi]|uniref:Uncharacterized protein n=1 Tax=Microbacterium elymi TaxID=2909587 RepID=A0ABY5NLE0_9MICO|nr:hypothetical protein [Microbacterium elymi]UUT36004.1 hypothetical protein L2X98_23130 [Microbacterium elymi]